MHRRAVGIGVILGLAVAIAALVWAYAGSGSSPDGEPPPDRVGAARPPDSASRSVRDIAGRLRGHGVRCSDLRLYPPSNVPALAGGGPGLLEHGTCALGAERDRLVTIQTYRDASSRKAALANYRNLFTQDGVEVNAVTANDWVVYAFFSDGVDDIQDAVGGSVICLGRCGATE